MTSAPPSAGAGGLEGLGGGRGGRRGAGGVAAPRGAAGAASPGAACAGAPGHGPRGDAPGAGRPPRRSSCRRARRAGCGAACRGRPRRPEAPSGEKCAPRAGVVGCLVLHVTVLLGTRPAGCPHTCGPRGFEGASGPLGILRVLAGRTSRLPLDNRAAAHVAVHEVHAADLHAAARDGVNHAAVAHVDAHVAGGAPAVAVEDEVAVLELAGGQRCRSRARPPASRGSRGCWSWWAGRARSPPHPSR